MEGRRPISPLQSQPTKTSYRNDRFQSHPDCSVSLPCTVKWSRHSRAKFILVQSLPWFCSSCPFMLIKELRFIPLLKTSLPWRPFWFLIRPDSNEYQSRISQFGFFQIRIIYCLNKIQWKLFRMTIHQDNQTHDKKRNQWEPVYNMEAFCKQALVWTIYLGILECIFLQL